MTKVILKAFALLCSSAFVFTGYAFGQALVGTSLTLTDNNNNSQEVGSSGTLGDSSCPDLATLKSGQYALCYRVVDSAWELGYPGSTYSPLARLSDIAAVTANTSTQITGVNNQVAALTKQLTALQSTVASLTANTAATAAPTTSAASTFLDVVWNGGTFMQSSFEPVSLATVNYDTASAFNRSTSTYTIPTTGYYMVIAKLRLGDNVPDGISFGMGAGISSVDDPNFIWFSTPKDSHSGATRNGALNTNVVHYNAGDQVKMYAYLDYEALLPMTWGRLTIIKVGQ